MPIPTINVTSGGSSLWLHCHNGGADLWGHGRFEDGDLSKLAVRAEQFHEYERDQDRAENKLEQQSQAERRDTPRTFLCRPRIQAWGLQARMNP
jgi:hypothetical protein